MKALKVRGFFKDAIDSKDGFVTTAKKERVMGHMAGAIYLRILSKQK